MDPSQWAGQTNACTPQTTGPDGPDRITKTTYNAASEVISVRTSVGTAIESPEVAYIYRNNGGIATVKDGENNLTTYEYDGHDRLDKTRYPLPTKGANASSITDFEQPSYDANGNVTQLRQRNGQMIGYSYDNLNRLAVMDLVPGGINDDVTYTYNLLGRLKSAIGASNHSALFSYDALGRVTGESDTLGPGKLYEYDLAGRRTRYQYAQGGPSISYTYEVTGEVTSIRETGATSGPSVLGTYPYDSLGRRICLTSGTGTVSSYAYDPISRLASLTHNVTGTISDVTFGYIYTPAGQSKAVTRDAPTFAGAGLMKQVI